MCKTQNRPGRIRPRRETEVVNKFRAMAKERGLPLGHAETIIGAIVAMAYNIQGEEAA